MAGWHLAPALADLRDELNTIGPDRDKRSDGTIGDAAHQATSSKHNPNSQGVVRAFDCDKSGPWPAGWTFSTIVRLIVARHATGLDDRLQNVIWDRRIASRSWGWSWQDYTGPNAHTEHAHFEVRDSATYWNKRGPWGLLDLLEDGVAFADEKIKVTATTGAELYEPDLKPGTEVNAATVLQQAAIWARRAAINTDTLEATAAAVIDGQVKLSERVATIEQWLVKLTEPATPEQTAALLHAVLGARSAQVGRILAALED